MELFLYFMKYQSLSQLHVQEYQQRHIRIQQEMTTLLASISHDMKTVGVFSVFMMCL